MASGDIHIIGEWGGSLCGSGIGPTTARRQCQECVWKRDSRLPDGANDAITPVSPAPYDTHASDAKVVISMTSVPTRNGTLGPTLASLRNQTRLPDEIRLYLGDGCDHVSWKNNDGPELNCISSTDYGPVTKLSAAVDDRVRPDAIVITVDDDIVFAPLWLERLLGYVEQYPNEAIGMAGWNIDTLLSTGRYERAAGPCDVIEGFGGVAYRKWFFDQEILHPPKDIKFVDDVWISSYLNRLGIVRRVVPGQPELVDTTRSSQQAGIHTRPDFDALNKRAAVTGFPHHKEVAAMRARAATAYRP